ncbi:response regulator [Metapseudomonas furukawaii]|uniref:Transcriptional regulatory protein OmpR n=1 Tax=Metapseudomonas furukawaii TaxID=1149133 RepID=A0AAD1C2W3_METFU|nr:response regulator [Pseudomonas furukawaii]ELS28478.1 Two component Transcriptional regulator, Winged helix family [Pseudomonas furukawaii]BAU75067.1 transcriptional regulatory protein OmpR [Pseudomonas furukawaii]
MTEQIRILVVDDDEAIRELLLDYLGGQGYRVEAVADSVQMRAWLAEALPDLVLLDVGLPGEDGLSLARYLREHHDLPVIMVSGAGTPLDRIVGLEVGADDYLAKPFDPRELLARVKTVLRRYRRAPAAASPESVETGELLKVGLCRLDLASRQLFGADGSEIPLTAMEFDLLQAFAQRPNRPLSRDQLLNLTQHRDWNPFDRSIDIRIARLRRKLEPDPDKPQVIRTVRGVGYMFVPG